jgi:hypothetical protein
VWRASHLTNEEIARYIPGRVVTELAFTSTSRDPSRIFVGNVEFVIQSFGGRDISTNSARPNELEVLFDRGTSFEVRSVVHDPNANLFGVTRIHLYEVPAQTRPADIEHGSAQSGNDTVRHDTTPFENLDADRPDHPRMARHELPGIPGESNETPVGRNSIDDGSAELSHELQRIFADGVDTPAGRAYYPPDEQDMIDSALALDPMPGYYTVDMHGDPDSTYIGDDELSPADLAALIRADPNWTGEPIRLFCCETGQGPHPFAQRLADELGVDVIAPTEMAWGYPDGSSLVSSLVVDRFGNEFPKLPPDGTWRTFTAR